MQRLDVPIPVTLYERQSYNGTLASGEGIRQSVAAQPSNQTTVYNRPIRLLAVGYEVLLVQNHPVVQVSMVDGCGGEYSNLFIVSFDMNREMRSMYELAFPNWTQGRFATTCTVGNALNKFFGLEHNNQYVYHTGPGTLVKHCPGRRQFRLRSVYQVDALHDDYFHLFEVQKRLCLGFARAMVKNELFNVSYANNMLQNYCYRMTYDAVSGDVFELVDVYQFPATDAQIQEYLAHMMNLLNEVQNINITYSDASKNYDEAKGSYLVIDKVTVQKFQPHILIGYVS